VLATDIMTENPVVAREDMTADEAMRLFYELDFRHLPVVRDKELVGMLSDRDLRRFSSEKTDDPMTALSEARDATVGELMNTDPVRVTPEAEVSEIVDLMLMHRVGAIPVTDADTGDLLGIVSYVDLLRLLK
jgi:acetoin utilization protein AcuB